MDGACFAVGMVSREGAFQGSEEMSGCLVRIWWKLGGLQKLTVEVFFWKLWGVGSEERMGKPSLRMHLSLGRSG